MKPKKQFQQHDDAWSDLVLWMESRFGIPSRSRCSEARYWHINGKIVRVARHHNKESQSRADFNVLVSADYGTNRWHRKLVVVNDGDGLAMAKVLIERLATEK